MPASSVKIGLVQHACPPGKDQLKLACAMIRAAAQQGAQIVVTQELFRWHYFPQTENESNFALAEPVPGPTSEHLCALARTLRIEIVASLFESFSASTAS